MKALYDSIINMMLVKIYFGYLFQMKEYLCTPNVMVCMQAHPEILGATPIRVWGDPVLSYKFVINFYVKFFLLTPTKNDWIRIYFKYDLIYYMGKGVSKIV